MISNITALKKSILLLLFTLGSTVLAAQGIKNKQPDQKVDAQLLELYQQNSSRQKNNSIRSGSLYIIGDYVVIQASAENGSGKALLKELEAQGLEKGASFQNIVSGRMPIARLNELEQVKGLKNARPEIKPHTHTGSVTSEGVAAMRADLARSNFSVDGTGIKIGVLSDSYDALNGATSGISTGDLPGTGNPNGFTTPIEVIRDDLDPSNIDEGRAMFEIIHDVAPGAELAFHTAFGGAAVFAEGIILLADAGCDIIVDDVGYLTQPFFQDGIVAKAVDQVKARGVAFFSAAGNSGDASYESSYNAQSSSALNTTLGENYLDYHDFGGGDIRQNLSIPAGVTLQVTLQWDDPFFSAVSVGGAPGADTDLDFILLDNSDNVLASSASFNTSSGDPVEFIQYTNSTGTTQSVNFVIARFSGPAPLLIKYIDFTGITINEFATNSSTSFAHPNAAGAMGVGAAFWFQTPAFGTSPPEIEAFSSLGGTPIIFDTLGNRLGSFEDREKPDVVGPDGGNNTFFGQQIGDGDSNPNFFGTSAAAPHVAALAGLMLEASGGRGSLDPDTLYAILENTAIDMSSVGFDNVSGFGLVDGNAAVSDAQSRNVSNLPFLINEIDVDQSSTDTGEFIELYDGGSGNTSLDGLVLVFFDGTDDASYRAIDLDGESTDASGYYVVGNSGVSNVGLTFPNGTLQNGADAIALYQADASDFPTDSPLRTSGLLDAIVYDTNDEDDNGLLVLLNDSEPQLNEDENNDSENESLQRLPNGSGGTRNTSSYRTAAPTPGAENQSGPSACSISNISAGAPGACNPADNRYSIDITVTYANAPASGNLLVNGQAFAITSSPQTVTLSNLSSNGLDVDVAASFSEDALCTLSEPALFTAPSSCFTPPTIFINEIDADIADTEDQEFIELFDGGSGNTSLDNLVIVLYNGSDDQSYTPVFDLDGLQTDANGYFLIGGSNLTGIDNRVAANTGIRFDTPGWLQNGADAVVLFVGDDVQFPNDSPLQNNNIVDAVVYETADSDDPELLGLLNAGQGQADEDANRNKDNESIQRFPNGSGGAQNTESFIAAPPTPGEANVAIPQLQVLGDFPLNFGFADATILSDTLSYFIKGALLNTTDIIIAAPTNFQISLTQNSNYTDTLRLSDPGNFSSPTLDSTQIFVRFVPEPANKGFFQDSIQHIQDGQVIGKAAVLGDSFEESDIATLRNARDANGNPSISDTIRLRGVVHGINFAESQGAYTFTLIGGSNGPREGINLTVQGIEASSLGIQTELDNLEEGDELTVLGFLGSTFGVMQVEQPISITFLGKDNPIQSPATVSDLDEDTEGRLIQLENVSVLDSNQWLGGPTYSGLGFSFTVNTGSATVNIFIDDDTELAGLTYGEVFGNDTDFINLVGIGSQLDLSSPFTGDYLLLPYRAADLSVSKPSLQFQSVNAGQSLNTNAPFEVVVELRDRLGNLLNAESDLSVQLSLESGNGRLDGSLSSTISSGSNSASFSNLLYDLAEDGVILKAMIAGNDSIQAVLSDTLEFQLANLLITSINGGTDPIVDSTFSITVKIQNNDGQAQAARNNTTISLNLSQGTGNLTGSLSEVISAGSDSVVFNNLSYDVAESNVLVQAQVSSGDPLNAALSAAFDVLPITALPGFLRSGSLKIFPNPHVDRFRIQLEGEVQPQIQFYLYDSQGKIVFKDQGRNRDGDFEVNLGRLPAGVYTMILQVGDEKIAKQIIKQ